MSKLFNKALSMKLNSINFLSLTAIAAVLYLSSCKSDNNGAGKGAGMSGRSKKVNAEAYVVAPQSFSNTYTASGSLRPNEEIEVHPEMSGRVTSMSFHEGSVVRKGQLLVQLYDADLKAQLQRLQAQKRLQQSTEKRQRELVNIGGISRQDYEATETQMKYIDADIAVAEAALSKMRVLAPFDGTIGLRNVSIGAVISPSTVIATLQQIHPLKMDFNVPDQYRIHVLLDEHYFPVNASICCIHTGGLQGNPEGLFPI
jgi:membrane fusion protein (multidrug efflux system)